MIEKWDSTHIHSDALTLGIEAMELVVDWLLLSRLVRGCGTCGLVKVDVSVPTRPGGIH